MNLIPGVSQGIPSQTSEGDMPVGRRRNYLDVLTGAAPPDPTQSGGIGDLGGAVPMGSAAGAGMGAGLLDVAPDTSALSDDQVAALAQPGGAANYEDLQAQALMQQLDDPNLPPEQRAMLEQQLALAARRKLAGV